MWEQRCLVFLFGFLTTVIKKLSLPYYLRMKVIKLPNTNVWFLLESKSPLEKKILKTITPK
jgi:hypothetical protein